MNAAPPLEVGSILGAYRLESVLGVGGMGCVYRAVHTRLGRKAAIKVLSDSLARDPELVSRFFAEARVVSAVGHPNIIDIIDFIEIDEPRRVAYVMELIESPSLSSVLRSRRLTPRQSINLALQLVDASRAVHAINVVHRDLKPDNLLVTGSLEGDLSTRPSLKVLDFGIAKIQDPQAEHRTGTGMMMGTPAYMAPEQVAAEAVSAATDIYAIGEILYEMLTGKRMFSGQNMTILRAKIAEQPPAVVIPEEIAESERLAALIRACVQQSPAERPDIGTVEAELLEALHEQPMLDAPRPAEPRRASSSVARVPMPAPAPVVEAALATPMFQPTAAVQLPQPGRGRAIAIAFGVCAVAAAGALFAMRGGSQDAPAVQAIAEIPAPLAEVAAPDAEKVAKATELAAEKAAEAAAAEAAVVKAAEAARALEAEAGAKPGAAKAAAKAEALVVKAAEVASEKAAEAAKAEAAAAAAARGAPVAAQQKPKAKTKPEAAKPEGAKPEAAKVEGPLKKGEYPEW